MNLKRKLRQNAVWWSTTGRKESGGFLFDEPEEIKCRWEDREEIVNLTTGESRQSSTTVFVSDSVKENDMLFLGTLADIDSDADPMSEENARQVIKVNKIPNLRNTILIRKVFL